MPALISLFQFFKLEVTKSNGDVPSLNQLISHLEVILKESEVIGPAIGILSSENRDAWSKAFEELIKGIKLLCLVHFISKQMVELQLLINVTV